MTRITINLDDQEKVGLLILSEKELRDPRLQAVFIIRKELEKQGLIKVHDLPAPAVLTSTPSRTENDTCYQPGVESK